MKKFDGPQQFLVCTLCRHEWPIARLPLPVSKMASMLKHAHCPNCNSVPANARLLPTREAVK